MKNIKLLSAFFAVSFLLMACNQNQPPPVANTEPAPANLTVAEDELPYDENDPLIKDNFDLQRVGDVLERSKNPQEFEAYLNEDDGLNNLDLNGDGYADYISVEEFDDRGDGQRGLSLFSRFGPDLIQEIATIFFYRDEPRYPGARVLLRGNDQIYGDNYYYESNWLDRSLGLVSLLFGDHDRYRSPYYYDHYPPDYVVYEVVDTPIYRTRIERLYPQPIFVYSNVVPVYWEKIKIKSPNNGLHLGQIYGRPLKPTKDQIEFRKKNQGKPAHAKKDKGDGGPGRSGDAPDRDKPMKEDHKVDKGPGKPDKVNKPGGPPQKADNPGKGGDPGKGPGKGPDKGQGKGPGKKGKP